MNTQEIEMAHAELKAAQEKLSAAQAQLTRTGIIEFNKITPSFEWSLKLSEFGFRIECRFDETTREEFKKWRNKFKDQTAPRHSSRIDALERWSGMDYRLLYTRDGDPLIIGMGGSVILAQMIGCLDPMRITHAQAEQFHNGVIPEELKNPW